MHRRTHASHCNLHVHQHLHQLCIYCNKAVNQRILLDGHIGKIQVTGNQTSLFFFLRVVGTKGGLPPHHAIDVVHFGKGRSPVRLPVGPGVIGDGTTLPFAPRQEHVPDGKGVFGPSGDHGGVGDRGAGVVCKDLAFFLFPGIHCQWYDWVDASVEFREIVVQVGLVDLGIHCWDVCDKHTQINAVEAFDWIIQYSVVDVLDGGDKLVACDGEDQVIGCPCLASGSVGGP
jgi:hypothetical protein